METAPHPLSASDRAAYESLPVPLCILYVNDGNYSVELVSDGLCRLLLTTREHMMQKSLLDFVFPEDRDFARNAAEFSVIYPGEEARAVFRVRQGNGEWLRIACSGHSMAAVCGGSLLFLFYSALLAEPAACGLSSEAVRPREETSHAAEKKNYQVARWQADLTDEATVSYEGFGPRALKLPAQLPYQQALAFVLSTLPIDAERENMSRMLDAGSLKARYAEGRISFSMDYRRDEDSRMPFWITLFVNIFQVPSTGHIECVFTSFDVTEKILENQLISRLTTLGYDVVGLVSKDSGMCRFFRLKKKNFGMDYEQYQDYEEAINEDFERIIAPENRVQVREAFRLQRIFRGLEEGPVYAVPYAMTTSDGRHLQKLMQFSYLDERRDILFMCRSDVTKQYQAEAEQLRRLREAKLSAERANEAKSMFLSSMSHDLRTPLNGIIGFTNLAMHEKSAEKKQLYLGKVRSSSELLLDLVNDTLELSRIESGKYVFEPEAVSIREMARTVTVALGPSAEIKGLHFYADVESYPDLVVWTDKLKFQKVFLNLLSNAIKYTPSGGSVSARIELLDAPIEGRNCRVVVQDTGIGIKQEFLPHIFDAFSQEKRPESANILGTGLGLSIVRRIVDMEKGKISVDSVPGKGTTFTVELQLPPATRMERESCPNAQEGVTLQGRRVLLCEDNYLNVEIARILLEEQGVQVDHAEDGRQGLEAFSASPLYHYDAVLMDIRMPVMDGYEAAQRIRELPRPDAGTVPILAMTADSFDEDFRNCAASGMNGQVTKPIDPTRLFSALRHALVRSEKE